MKTTQIERMSWTDFRDAMTETDTIIIPTGVMEEHGPHVPLATDTIEMMKFHPASIPIGRPSPSEAY